MESQRLIDWFWKEAHSYYPAIEEGFCWHYFRDSRNIISESSDPNKMAAFLLVSLFVDQSAYTHLNERYTHHSGFPHKASVYDRFRKIFRFPKFYNCDGEGGYMVPPGAIVWDSDMRSFYQLDVDILKYLADTVLYDVYDWVLKETNTRLLYELHNYFLAEVRIEFGSWKETDDRVSSKLFDDVASSMTDALNSAWCSVI